MEVASIDEGTKNGRGRQKITLKELVKMDMLIKEGAETLFCQI